MHHKQRLQEYVNLHMHESTRQAFVLSPHMLPVPRACFMNHLGRNIQGLFCIFLAVYLTPQSFLYDNEKPLTAVKQPRREIMFFIEIRLK